MILATWNIGEDEKNKDNILNLNSYEYIKNTIINENIDIICLQEAIIKSDILPPIAKYIKENTDLKYTVEFELSDSHINIGSRMGIVICSKYKIDSYKQFMLDNPNFIYSVNENTIYYSHDKGFIIASIKGFNIVTGHCLPFHIFKKSPLDYLEIFKKADKEFINYYNLNRKFILCGDFNYENINPLFPEIMSKCTDLIKVPTRKEKQLDHFIISNELKYISCNIKDNVFDHKLCITELEN